MKKLIQVDMKDFPQEEGETSEEYRLRLNRESQKKRDAACRPRLGKKESSYTQASPVRITDRDGNTRVEASLNPEEFRQIEKQAWIALPSRGQGVRVKTTGRAPKTWGMSPTREEKEAAHRERLRQLASGEGERSPRN